MPRKKKENLVHLDIDELTKSRPVKSETTYTTLGQRLSEQRKKKGWNLEDISATLRIKPVYLDALEKGHYYAFPAQSYAIGFLRSYAKYLQLDPDEIIALYHQETSDMKEEPLDMLVIEKHFSLPSKKVIIITLGVLILLYAIWYMVAIQYNPDEFINTQLTKDVTPVVEENTTDIVDSNSLEKNVSKNTATTEISDVSVDVYTSPVAFVAIDRVWVSIKDTSKNKILIDKTFQKNEHYIPTTALENLTVSTGRANMLDLYLNGKRVKTFSKEENLPLTDLVTE